MGLSGGNLRLRSAEVRLPDFRGGFHDLYRLFGGVTRRGPPAARFSSSPRATQVDRSKQVCRYGSDAPRRERNAARKGRRIMEA